MALYRVRKGDEPTYFRIEANDLIAAKKKLRNWMNSIPGARTRLNQINEHFR